MTLAIDGRADVQKGRDVLRGGGPVACVMPVEFVTLLAIGAPARSVVGIAKPRVGSY
jgi:hypothetical protein